MSRREDPLGNGLSHFVAVSTLLFLLDPVRGKPTVYSLDRHPNDSTWRHDNLQTRFLDSFALICSTASKGAETASAVCLEQDHSSGNILRLARNIGVPDNLIDRLQIVLGKLMVVAFKGGTTPELENGILSDILEITRDKIRSLLEWLGKTIVHEDVNRIMEKVKHTESYCQGEESPGFRRWVSNLPALFSLPVDAGPLTLIPHIKWASRARWAYSRQLKSLLCPDKEHMPLWVNTIYKLGRYYAATEAMIKFASSQPEIFRSIRIEAVECPRQQLFSVQDWKPLTSLLRRLDKTNHIHLMARLSQTWLETNTDAYFRKKCKRTLTVHAEMQLLIFYDTHPELIPRLLFMGTSKKACYLCDRFLFLHPLKMVISASHQKIWPSWMPPSCTGPSMQMYKDLVRALKDDMEKAAARDLHGELGRRQSPNQDSTAGPPITFTSTFWTLHESVK